MLKPDNDRADRLAVLIDADNMSPRLIEGLLVEVAKYGTANVKRAYGDWTTDNLGGWKEKLHRFAIQPMQQFRYTRGKNSSDSALIIDAMDLLHSGVFDGFCLVSSDSDFTRLACRIREAGVTVYGFGERKTPEPFVRACDRFVYVENLSASPSVAAPGEEGRVGSEELPPPTTTIVRDTVDPRSAEVAVADTHPLGAEQIGLIRSAYEAAAPEHDWVSLGPLGSQILRTSPSFDARTYGFRNLTDLITATGLFETQTRVSRKDKVSNHLFVRLKPEPPSS